MYTMVSICFQCVVIYRLHAAQGLVDYWSSTIFNHTGMIRSNFLEDK